MTEGLPWKLYRAVEGEPRQLLDAFPTLKAASIELAEVVGAKADRLALLATVDLGKSSGQPTRFVCANHKYPYVIELFERVIDEAAN